MSLSLSAPPPPLRSAGPARQRGALLLASVALHAAVLIPVALNIVAPTRWEATNRTFEVWIDMPVPERLKPKPRELPRPITPPQAQPDIIPPEQMREDVMPEPRPLPVPEPVRPQQQTLSSQQQARLDAINQQMPQLAPQPEPQAAPSESFDNQAPATPVTGLTALPNVNVYRPHIEAIEGPSPARDIKPLAGSASMPSVQNQSATAASDQTGPTDIPNDMPIPRRARMTAEEEAALAAAAASGALDDAWVYQPRPGEQAGGWGSPPAGTSAGGAGAPAVPSAGAGLSAGTAVFRGTPVDCTQPQMLSDIQRLSCDSAESRRIRSAIERGVQVMGTGDADRDARNTRDGQQRISDHEQRRLAPPASQRGNVGVEDSPANTFGTGAAGRHLDPTMRPDSVAPLQTKRDGPSEQRPQRTPN